MLYLKHGPNSMEFEVGISVSYLCSYYSFIIYNRNTGVLMVDTNKETQKHFS